MKKLDLSQYKIPEQQTSKLQSFQEYALKIIKQFNVDKEYQPIIWKHAKRNRCYLEGKVALCYEKFGEKLEDKGHYLISLFRKKKPWDKT
jgi:hypothetical protein